MIDERQVREMLHQRADAISASPRDAATAVQRARRGVTMTGLIGVAALVIIAFAAIGGVRTVLEQPVPIGPPVTPPPTSGPEPDVNEVPHGPTDLTLVGVPSGHAVSFGSVLDGSLGAHEFTLSPDRRRVAFVAHLPGTTSYGIFMVDLSDPVAQPRQIALDLAMPTGGGFGTTLGGWSGDGTRLVATDASEHSIWIIDAASGEAKRVLDGGSFGGATVLAPTFVPGEEALSFTVMKASTGSLMDPPTGGREDAALWTMPIGGEPSKLLDHAAFGTYSPDGSSIVYRSIHPGSPLGAGDIMMADADGSGPSVLKEEGFLMGFPPLAAQAEWSPDGSRLLVATVGAPNWPNTAEFTILDVASGREQELGSAQSATWWDERTVLVGSYGCKDFSSC